MKSNEWFSIDWIINGSKNLASYVFPKVPLIIEITLLLESKLILEEPKVNPPEPTSNPPIEAETNLAYPFDVIEAEAFAYIAIRSLKKLPLSLKTTTGVKKSMSGGVIYKVN